MDTFTPIQSTIGGLLIGVASLLIVYFQARIAGISGIVGALLQPQPGDRAWRIAFVVGLLGTGALLASTQPQLFGAAVVRGPWLALAGLLVGFGARLGNGCTSGHGVCGISRMSPRSLAATGTFMGFGAAAAILTAKLIGG